jgi:phosphatidate cytidylyltransferase
MAVPRRILIRVIGAPLLVAALCGIIYWGYTPLTVLVCVVAILCGVELFEMCAVKGIATARIAGLVAIAVYFIPWGLLSEAALKNSPWPYWVNRWTGAGLALYLLFMMVFRYGRLTPDGAALTFLGFGYVALLKHVFLVQMDPGLLPYYLLFLLAGGKGSDMAAFVAGKTIGKHKMTPVVSPNKTWEGGIAGGIVGTGAGLAVIMLTPLRSAYGGVPVYALLLFCLLVTIAAQVGDLVKSAFKRWAGVKDSGRLLPEFGGMIDMVDSFLLEGPVACLGSMLLFKIFKGT